MALTQISTQGIKDGTITGSDLATNVDLVDNQKLRLGTGNDLQIYHDGTDSYIKDAGTGRLMLLSNQFQVNSADNSEIQISAIENGAVNLYYNGSKKFETLSTGAKVTGRLGVDLSPATAVEVQLDTFAATGNDDASDWGAGGIFQLLHSGTAAVNNEVLLLGAVSGAVGQIACGFGFGRESTTNWGTYISFKTHSTSTVNIDELIERWKITSDGHFENNSDSIRIKLGASDDLQIYHEGNHSYIQDAGTGSLIIVGNNVTMQKADQSANLFSATENSSVDLYFNGSKKLETYSGGVNIFGRIAPNEFQISDNEKAYFGTGLDLEIYHDGNHSYVADNGAGELRLASFNGSGVRITKSDSETLANFTNDGAVELYHDNSKKFETVAGGVKTNDNNYMGFGNGNDLQIYHDGSNSYISEVGTGNLQIQSANSVEIESNTGEKCARFHPDGAVELFYDNSKKFETNSTGCFVAGTLGVNPPSTGDVTINKEGTGTLVRLRTTGTTRGTITSNGSTVAYNTSVSDRSMKKNFEDWTEDTLALFKNINPQRFNFLNQEDGTDKEKGFIAQDLVTSFPEAYPKINDKYMFNPSAMVVYLMKAIQELEAEVAALKAS